MRKAVVACLLIATLVLSVVGCVEVVRTAPPPPREEMRPVAPHHEALWIEGHWARMHGQWEWVPGYWERPPHRGAAWVPGHWVERGGSGGGYRATGDDARPLLCS
jgi:WXXGXW repeat (2 copies)